MQHRPLETDVLFVEREGARKALVIASVALRAVWRRFNENSMVELTLKEVSWATHDDIVQLYLEQGGMLYQMIE